MGMDRVAFLSLGCAKNLVNTEQMAALTADAGFTLADDPDGADIAVVNTCGFIDSAKAEAIEEILALAELKAAGRLKKILVAGCLVQRYREEILTELPEVDGLLGCGSFPDIVEALQALGRDEVPVQMGDIDAPEPELPRLLSTPPWTAFLKIAEGCSNRCAFCVIPSLRGRYRSRAFEDILSEAEGLAESGVRELIVIAQDITRYGIDRYGKPRLGELLAELCKLDFHWIRLHYLYPEAVDDALIDVIAGEEKILPYLDIPIQHISDSVLARMNRRGTGAEIRLLIGTLRARIPGLVLRTSLLVGFPGETEEDFEALCAFLRETRIQRAGVFPFSPQEGTPAAEMPDQVPEETAQHRAELLGELQAEIMEDYGESLTGTALEVLCEGYDEDLCLWYGRSYGESPEVDGRILFAAEEPQPGDFVTVVIRGTLDGEPVGEAV